MANSSLLGTDELPPVVPAQDEKTIALLAHIITIVSAFIAPLIIYFIKKDESPFVREHARESLNFQITCLIIYFGLFITIIGIFLIWFMALYALALVIIATIRANEGKLYHYPFSIKIFK